MHKLVKIQQFYNLFYYFIFFFFSEKYFKPNSSHQYVIGGRKVGQITSATLKWVHRTTMNVLTWRFDPVIFVGSVTVETFVDDQR